MSSEHPTLTTLINSELSSLHDTHLQALERSDDDLFLSTHRHATLLRHLHTLHLALTDLLPTLTSSPLSLYLTSLHARFRSSLSSPLELRSLTTTTAIALHQISNPGPFSLPSKPRNRISRSDRIAVVLYVVMVLLAIAAVVAVTVDFVQRSINPSAFIRSEVKDSLQAPVVTVCVSQRGVPFSRLQLFNFTDASGEVFQGADPSGEQRARESEDFREVVERFWDNPNGENCTATVGDYFPFPLEEMNKRIRGETDTQCRPCWRVGSRREVTVESTDFRNSSALEFYTDSYFLMCLKRSGGLTKEGLRDMRDVAKLRADRMKELGVLTRAGGGDVEDEAFSELDSKTLCNAFYFGFFPKDLGVGTGNVDVRYEWDGIQWNESGEGPYLEEVTKKGNFLPEESLQLFVSTNRTTKPRQIGKNRDMILIGPNTQTYATMRPIVVYGEERYDVTSSTSGLRETGVVTLFGYWLVYRVFYNYNRFVVDEWYTESTYPVSQWLVDLTGYASLFTGASLFSVLLLPLLGTVRRREKQRLRREKPEVVVWEKHRRRVQGIKAWLGKEEDDDEEVGLVDSGLEKKGSVVLPGYNL